MKADTTADGIVRGRCLQKDAGAPSGIDKVFLGKHGQRVPHRVPVHPKSLRQGGFCRQFVSGAIKALCDITSQRVSNGLPDRGSGGHVIKTSHFGGLADPMLPVNICLVVYTTS